jgi:hypothetical protein
VQYLILNLDQPVKTCFGSGAHVKQKPFVSLAAASAAASKFAAAEPVLREDLAD